MNEKYNFDLDDDNVFKSVTMAQKLPLIKRKYVSDVENSSYEVFQTIQMPKKHKQELDNLLTPKNNALTCLLMEADRELDEYNYCRFPLLQNFQIGEIFRVKQFYVNCCGTRFEHLWVVEDSEGFVGLIYKKNLIISKVKTLNRSEKLLCKSKSSLGFVKVMDKGFVSFNTLHLHLLLTTSFPRITMNPKLKIIKTHIISKQLINIVNLINLI